MKKSLMVLSMLVVSMAVMAVPARRGVWKTLKLADGTEVRAQLTGDEHGHFWQDANGKAYVKGADATYYQEVNADAVMQKAKTSRQRVNAQRIKRLAAARRADSGSGYFGQKKGVIILVNFSDKKFQSGHNNALYQRIANEENFSQGSFVGSMSDYFKAQSNGQFELDFDIVGPVTVSKKYSYYGGNDSEGNDNHPSEMVCEAVTLAKSSISDWTQYDWNQDGEIDQIYIVYAGYGEASSEDENTIWPHAFDLQSANYYYNDGTGPVTVATGLKVNTYACGSELNGYGELDGIGTMCHEFSHCLGYPDFYDTDYSGGWGMDCWDLMDQGSYNGDGYQPAGYTSYERWVAGWQEPVVLENEDASIENVKALQDGGTGYIIYNKKNRNEYYLLENRQLTGWDTSLPGSGLLILHVDYDQSIWENNTPNDDPDHQRMTWMAADNKYQTERYDGYEYLTYSGLANDPYPYNSNNKFNKDTKPAAKFYNKQKKLSTNMESSVEDITQNSNGTISFRFVAQYAGSSTEPTENPDIEGALFYESFDECNGTGGNDDNWGSSVASSTFTPDSDGWSYEAAYGGYQCARFGSSKKSGTVTTPTIQLTANDNVLTFKAAAWGSDNKTLKLTAEDATVLIEPNEFQMTSGEWTTHTAKLTGTGNVRLKFTPGKRFFLDEVLVKPQQSTGIMTVERTASHADVYFTLDGRRVNGLPSKKGLYILNGKKVVLR